jgi:hypothetical protein
METYLVQGCGVSLVCEKGQTMTEWLSYILARGGVPTVSRWAGRLVVLAALLIGAQGLSHAASTQDLDQMTSYADNAILDAAVAGHKAVTLKFGHANPELIEALASSLRTRGYALDEEATLLNPSIIKVRGLKNSAVARSFSETR